MIGGGIGGVSVAADLAEHGADVVLIEAEPTLAFHTTGRSAAVYLENYGTDDIRRMSLASRDYFESPPDEFHDDLGPGGIFSPRLVLTVGTHEHLDQLRDVETRGKAMVDTIRWVEPDEAVELCPILRRERLAGAVMESGSQEIDVGALHQGFVRAFRARGGSILTETPAEVLVRQAGGAWQVTAAGTTLTASIVVNAAGAWGDVVAERAGVDPIGLRPLRRTAFMVDSPRDESGATVDTSTWPLIHETTEDFYVKPEGEQLLCSPADETPSEPCDAKPEEIDIARAIERINEVTTLDIRHVKTSWAGLRTFSPDRNPITGFDPDHDGFFWLVAQGGTGIQSSPGAARAASSMIRAEPLPSDLAERGLEADALSPARFR